MTEADRRVRAAAREVGISTQRWLDRNAEDFVCDFCAFKIEGQFVTYTLSEPIVEELDMLAASSGGIGAGKLATSYTEDWAACLLCDAVVQQEDAGKLAEYVVANCDVQRIGSRPEARDLIELYQEFFARSRERKIEEVKK